MNTLPLITLGIPIYNAAGLIERTLLSALNQTYPNIEFIFVDDKGDSMDIVRRVAGNIHAEVLSVLSTKWSIRVRGRHVIPLSRRRRGISVSMDCDDVLIPECIGAV